MDFYPRRHHCLMQILIATPFCRTRSPNATESQNLQNHSHCNSQNQKDSSLIWHHISMAHEKTRRAREPATSCLQRPKAAHRDHQMLQGPGTNQTLPQAQKPAQAQKPPARPQRPPTRLHHHLRKRRQRATRPSSPSNRRGQGRDLAGWMLVSPKPQPTWGGARRMISTRQP